MPIQSCGQSVSAQRGKRYTEIGLFQALSTWLSLGQPAQPYLQACQDVRVRGERGGARGLPRSRLIYNALRRLFVSSRISWQHDSSVQALGAHTFPVSSFLRDTTRCDPLYFET